MLLIVFRFGSCQRVAWLVQQEELIEPNAFITPLRCSKSSRFHHPLLKAIEVLHLSGFIAKGWLIISNSLRVLLASYARPTRHWLELCSEIVCKSQLDLFWRTNKSALGQLRRQHCDLARARIDYYWLNALPTWWEWEESSKTWIISVGGLQLRSIKIANLKLTMLRNWSLKWIYCDKHLSVIPADLLVVGCVEKIGSGMSRWRARIWQTLREFPAILSQCRWEAT